MPARVLISAGEASGDLYAAALARALGRIDPAIEFFGCGGPRMRDAGVEAVIESESLAVVGLVEVLTHLPRIYRQYRTLVAAARARRPALAILADSPDFHFPVAKKLTKMGIPVVWLVAPQVWAWRRGRLRAMRRVIDRLLCIFPFEERFFAAHGIPARYIGHPLTRLVRPSASPLDLRREFGVADGAKLVALLPGSRPGEIERHLPVILRAIERIEAVLEKDGPRICPILALPPGLCASLGAKFRERFSASSIQIREGQTWDVLACADLALAASGTVTIEACLLNTPMVAFYRVNGLSWILGKLLVRVPFYSMVNLIAGRQIVPELIQRNMTPQRLADEACMLLTNDTARGRMRADLAETARRLAGPPDRLENDPLEIAATLAAELLDKEMVHAS